MIISKDPKQLKSIFNNGGVFAYPTEAVFGLGCDPDNESAVLKILAFKKRPVHKGLILVASDFSQVEHYLQPLTKQQTEFTRPSATTYIFPALPTAPKWVTGDFDSIAIRISKFPIVRDICDELESAIVSTSANLAGQDPAKTNQEVKEVFDNQIDALFSGEVGNALKPSTIRDSLTGEIIRA